MTRWIIWVVLVVIWALGFFVGGLNRETNPVTGWIAGVAAVLYLPFLCLNGAWLARFLMEERVGYTVCKVHYPSSREPFLFGNLVWLQIRLHSKTFWIFFDRSEVFRQDLPQRRTRIQAGDNVRLGLHSVTGSGQEWCLLVTLKTSLPAQPDPAIEELIRCITSSP